MEANLQVVITGLEVAMGWIEEVLGRIAGRRITVFGDFCLDAYWLLDGEDEEKSVETGLAVRRVRGQRYSLGGAGNVVANLVSLGIGNVAVVGMAGQDLFGAEMVRQLEKLGVDAAGLYRAQGDWQTMIYAKPCWAERSGQEGREDHRIDFGAFNVLQKGSEEWLIAALTRAAAETDVVVLNQQIPQGVSSPGVIARINKVVAESPRARFIVDSRHRAELYAGAMLKLNAHEAARVLGMPVALEERVPLERARELALGLWRRNRQPVFLTRGEHGLLVADGDAVEVIPGIQILDPIDPVGAGDTAVGALAAALAGGVDVATAGKFANVAASVTVRKLQTTGTASPAELRAVGGEPDYVYLPELAESVRRARFVEGTEIEVVRELPRGMKIGHAVFDHDGTLSVLREGWEKIMEPMMVAAILGARVKDVEDGTYEMVVRASRDFIDKTTGIQTLVQMKGLASLVRRFGFVPTEEILDEHGYKRLYNEELLKMVRGRVRKLENGELASEDFQIKNAAVLLRRLREAGVKLYLASGTDEADVIEEAKAMGYAAMFEGRIFGAVGDVTVEAKKLVLERIVREHRLDGPQFVMFGDGPVEMRETRKRGGICVGVASDELRRFGVNEAKRKRLIRAGADLVVPDFSQVGRLLGVLGVGTM